MIATFLLISEHHNYFGLDENVGPVAISLKREKLDERDCVGNRGEGATNGMYQFRVIIRTSEVSLCLIISYYTYIYCHCDVVKSYQLSCSYNLFALDTIGVKERQCQFLQCPLTW